jgi:hypothetical protein
MPTPPPNTFGPIKDRRKSAPVKRITISAEARKIYEDEMREREKREREITRFLPDEMKGKR